MKDKTATRRDLFVKAGAAACAPAALALGVPANAQWGSQLPQRLAELEDGNALRRLTAELIGLVNEESAVHSLLRPSVVEIAPSDFDLHATVHVDTERHHAKVLLPCTVTVDMPIDAPDSVLLDMAMLQGEGLLQQQQIQTLRLSCIRSENEWSVVQAELEDAA